MFCKNPDIGITQREDWKFLDFKIILKACFAVSISYKSFQFYFITRINFMDREIESPYLHKCSQSH